MAPAIEPTTPVESPIAISDEVDQASDQMSVVSYTPEMEPFEEYKPKLEKLLEEIGFPKCSIECIQHGYEFQNCVYALTSLSDPTQQFIFRVPEGSPFEQTDRCPGIEDSVCVLNFLKHRLPVPESKNFSATPDNSLESPYAIQTRLAGQSLNHVYGSLDCAEKRGIMDQYIDLIVKMESIRLTTAGSLGAPNPLPKDIEASSDIPAPSVQLFNGHSTGPIEDPTILGDRAGSDIKRLFKSLIAKYIAAQLQSIADGYNGSRLPIWRKMETMLEEMDEEGFFRPSPEPIVMHHWDLEARNIMVENTNGSWKVTGIIDWDDAMSLPRPLARKPPAWFWTWKDSDEDVSSDESDCDEFPDRELTEEDLALKAYFDRRVEEVLPDYLEDAYGSGKLLRRLWVFISDGLSRQWTVPTCEKLLEEWEDRPRDGDVSPPQVPDETMPAELTREQPQPAKSESEQSAKSFSEALKRGWKKAVDWVAIRVKVLPS